jgi:hypothetical protein
VIVRRLLALALLASVMVTGCYASNVVEADARAVVVEADDLVWRPGQVADLPGFYRSTAIEGDAAGVVLEAYYYFAESGAYSGAALVIGEVGPRFLVIAEDGRWTLDPDGLDLNDGSGKLELLTAEGHVKLVTPTSAIVFERVELR